MQFALLQFGIRGKVPIPDVIQGTQVQLQGVLYLRETKEEHQILYLRDVVLYQDNQRLESANIILYDKEHMQVSLGNSIIATGDIYFFQSARNPGNFNQEEYYQRKNISAFLSRVTWEVSEDSVWKIRETLQGVQESWKALFENTLGEREGRVMSAILLGTRGDVDTEIRELYRQSGIVHILSISGLHISFIGVALQKILQKCRCPAILSIVLAGGILSVYVVFVGTPISAIRAFIMYLVGAGALLSGRVYDGKTSLALAGAIIAIWNPLALLEAGFLLSFGALAGIIIIIPMIRRAVPQIPKPVRSIYTGVAVHLAIIPILLFYYYEWFPYSFLMNLVVVPLIGVAMAMGIFGGAVWFVCSTIGGMILRGCQIILVLCEAICRYFVEFPGSNLVVGKPTFWNMLVYYLILYLLYFILRDLVKRTWKKRVVLFVGILLAHVCLCFRYADSQMLEIVMLDVGQGDGIFIKTTKGTTYFIDAGSNDIKGVGQYRVEPFLKSQGVATLDYVLISHGHADHMNGIVEMLERQEYGVKIRNIILPHTSVHDEALQALAKQAQAKGVHLYTITAGERLSEGAFSLTCLQPDSSYNGELGNSASMVLSLQYGEFDMLFTGDLEGVGEQMLTQAMPVQAYEVLKVAHHGSKHSTQIAFLEKVNPRYALISSGVRNTYGHPHPETIERLEMFESVIYRTNMNGAITIRTDGSKMHIEEYLVF